MKSNPLRSSDIRIHNQKILLSCIYEARKNGISQSELVAKTGLKAPTVFRIFSILEEQRLIKVLEKEDEIRENPISKGRRPVLYTVCKDSLYTIGLEFWASCVSLGIFDFGGEQISCQIEPLKADINIDETIDIITLMVNKTLENLNIDRNKVAGMAVAAPGQVDLVAQRVINYSRIQGMRDIPLAEILQNKLDFLVIIHNNCSVIAFSEYKYGGYDHGGSLFTFLLRFGVNGSFVDEQGIHTTKRGITTETGHVPVDSSGPACSCGLNGCLESKLRALDTTNAQKQGLLFQGLEAQLAAGEKKAEQTAVKAADYLFIVSKGMMRIFAPQSFLILGNGELVARKIAENLQKRWTEESDIFVSTPPKIFNGAYNTEITQRGASDLVIANYFS